MKKFLVLVALLCSGCATMTPKRVQNVAFVVIGGSIVATAIAHGHGKREAIVFEDVPVPVSPCLANPEACR